METQKFLRMLDRKAIISGFYLVMAVAFLFAHYYFWDLHDFDYARNGLSPVSSFDDMFRPFVGLLVIATSIVYVIHFIYGAFYYPMKYRRDIKMNMESCDPEFEKVNDDASTLRGIPICLVWALIFFFGFYEAFTISTLIIIVASWFLLHLILIKLTSTANDFILVTPTIDLAIIMPNEGSEYWSGGHYYKDLYFFIPTSVDESAWSEIYIREYVKSLRTIKNENDVDHKQIKNLSEKLARG